MARSGDLTRSTSVQCGLNSKIPLECVLCVLCVFEMSQIWLACVPLAIRHFKKSSVHGSSLFLMCAIIATSSTSAVYVCVRACTMYISK